MVFNYYYWLRVFTIFIVFRCPDRHILSFTMYLIKLADTNIIYSGYCFLIKIMILRFDILKSFIGTDMTYKIIMSMCR